MSLFPADTIINSEKKNQTLYLPHRNIDGTGVLVTMYTYEDFHNHHYRTALVIQSNFQKTIPRNTYV